jgi:hypothetical protein
VQYITPSASIDSQIWRVKFQFFNSDNVLTDSDAKGDIR